MAVPNVRIPNSPAAISRCRLKGAFAPYAYVHDLDVSAWPPGLYNIVLVDKGRPRATARLVVAR